MALIAGFGASVDASADAGAGVSGPATGATQGLDPSGALTLQDALALALRQNPGLAADSLEVLAREAQARQAARRPNPEFSVEVENVAGTGALSGLGGAETTLGLSHRLELGGKRGKRLHAAGLERDLARRDHDLGKLKVVAATTTAFVEVVAAQERVALADTLVDLAEQVLASVVRRVQEGGASRIEERRARVSVETVRVERDRTRRSLDIARLRLASAWGGATATFDRAVGEIAVVGSDDVPRLDSLVRRLDTGPDAGRYDIEVAALEATAALEGALGVPDLTLGGGARYLNEPDERAFLAGASVPLPLFDRNRDAAAAAGLRVRQARERRQAALAAARVALAAAHADLAAARSEVVALRDRILPEAEAAFTEAHEAYVRGRLRFTDVLDAERSLAELRGRYIDVLAAHRTRTVEIERLLGVPLEETTSSTGDR